MIAGKKGTIPQRIIQRLKEFTETLKHNKLRKKWKDLLDDQNVKARTPSKNEALRKDTIKHFPHIKTFTCDKCKIAGAKEFCPFIYDPYNTDDECLALK